MVVHVYMQNPILLTKPTKNFEHLSLDEHFEVSVVKLVHFKLDIICVCIYTSGFGGLGVACWPLVPKFAGSNPAEAVGVLGRKNPQHAFLRRGSKAVGPMS